MFSSKGFREETRNKNTMFEMTTTIKQQIKDGPETNEVTIKRLNVARIEFAGGSLSMTHAKQSEN